MANTRSAAKRARQIAKRSVRNRSVLTNLKSQLKKATTEIGAKAETAKTAAQKLVSTLDKAVKSGRIHRNKANRHKSRLAKKLATPAS